VSIGYFIGQRVGVLVVLERMIMGFDFAEVSAGASCAAGVEVYVLDSMVSRWMWCR
jgi:hypothetical protein